MQHERLCTSKSSIFSWLSGVMGKRCGNLMSPLSPANTSHAEGPALTFGSFRSGNMVPRRLRGPLLQSPFKSATHSHTSKGRSVTSSSNGKPCLHTFSGNHKGVVCAERWYGSAAINSATRGRAKKTKHKKRTKQEILAKSDRDLLITDVPTDQQPTTQ